MSLEYRKYVSLCFLACGVVAGLLVRELSEVVWAFTHLPRLAQWILAPTDLIGIAAGITTFICLMRSSRVMLFTNEVISELSKVTWPERKETAVSTGVVSVLVGICALILFGFDSIWGTLVGIFYQ